MNRERVLSYVLIFLLLFCAVSSVYLIRSKERGARIAKPKIGVVNIYGTISVPSRTTYIFGLRGSDRVVQQLRDLRRMNVRAVVLRINSPGGTLGACQEIVEEIKKLKEEKIPVVASCGDIAASGGYYIASVCDKIVLNPGTITGSIGVLMGTSNFEELLKKIGIEPEVIKSGKYKDMGSIYRALSDEERKLLQELVDETYNQFLRTVSEGRKIPVGELLPLAQGQIFTGEQAIKYKLADKIGNLNTSLEVAKKLAGIKGEVQIIENPMPLERFLGIFYDGAEVLAKLSEIL